MADFNSLFRLYEDQLNSAKAAAAQAKDLKNAQAKTALDATVEALRKNYEAGTGTVNQTYDGSITQANRATDQALGEAYVGKMLNARNLNQQMAAQGRSGGASESAQLALANNYQTNRANAEKDRTETLERLNLARNGELASLLQKKNAGEASANDTYFERLATAEDTFNAALQAAQNTYQQNYAAAQAQQLAYQMEQERAAREAAAREAAARAAATSAAKQSDEQAKQDNKNLISRISKLNNTYTNQEIYNLLKAEGNSNAAIAKAMSFFVTDY